VAADQPFEATENPEFRRLLQYTHLRPGLHIPSASTVKRRIMKMGDDKIQGIKAMIAVCHFSLFNIFTDYILQHQELGCKVSLSLDAWTSSNGHGFLAIVVHYINNEWQLGTRFFIT
jgi:hypothetical protein